MIRGEPLRTGLRWPAAAAALVAGVAHVPSIPSQWAGAAYLGVLSVAYVVGSLSLAVLLVIADTRAVYGTASAFGRIAVLGLVFVRLMQLTPPAGGWPDGLGVASLVAAAAMAIVSGFTLAAQRRGGGSRAPRRGST